MDILKKPAKNFKRYGQKRTGPSDSIEIHSIGTSQNTALNVFNSMNQYNPGGIVHAIISADENNEVLEILPDDNVAWADAGYGNQHSYTIELCESDSMKYQPNSARFTILNEAKFLKDIQRGYDRAVEYVAIKCKQFGFDPMKKLSNGLYQVYSHQEANKLGLASAHVDPSHIWPYIDKDMDKFRKEVKEAMGTTKPITEPSVKNTDNIWMGWIKRESGAIGFKQVNGDSGNAYGKYQFDRRYALVPFMQYCVDYSKERYQGFERYIAYGAGSVELLNNPTLASLWQAYCERYPEEFEMLQDVYAYKYYYLEAVKYIKNLYGIIMDNHAPAVKGTLYSMSIRSGALVAARKFAGCNDATPDLVMLNIAYPTYGNQDSNRWTKAGQWGDSLKALENNEFTEVPTNMSDANKVEEKKQTYRVRLKWGTDMTTQIGAYTNLDNAIKAAKEAIPGYKVFDESGKIVFDTGELTVENQRKIAVKWAKNTANNNDHGYDNTKGKRGGTPDYACSSFVNEAWRQAGVDLPESGTVYTKDMPKIYKKHGFINVFNDVNVKNAKGMLAGDLPLTRGVHVEICDGNGNLTGARGNANSGKPENGKSGDQSGNEIVTSGYYNNPWKVVLRYVGTGKEETPKEPETKKEYVVQAGSFSSETNAKNRINAIKAKGIEAIVKKIDGAYKVQCGVFSIEENAKKRVQQLKNAGFEAIIK